MSDAARDLRYARWLLERASGEWPSTIGRRQARRYLARVGGDYLPDEEALFAQLQAESDTQMDFWAQGQEPR